MMLLHCDCSSLFACETLKKQSKIVRCAESAMYGNDAMARLMRRAKDTSSFSRCISLFRFFIVDIVTPAVKPLLFSKVF